MSDFRRRLLMRKGEIPYQQVEYLQSDSSAYIDTGIGGGSDDLEIYCKILWERHVDYGIIYSNFLDNYHNVTRLVLGNLGGANDKTLLYETFNRSPYSPYTITLSEVPANNIYEVFSSANSVIINGVTHYRPSISLEFNNRNIILWNLPDAVFRDIGLKIYSFKISKNGEVLRDFVPVRVGDVGYMYDKVSKQLFGSIGTGQFILGQDI